MKKDFLYTEENTNEISFPLGGIGSGCIGLAGNGALIDWEIFNRPAKGSLNGFSHFAIKVENANEVIDARILQSDLRPPYTGTFQKTWFYEGFGWGPRRENLAGLPHFAKSEFIGKFPFANIHFMDDEFPANVKMEAFNPFIPLDPDNSSLPAAFFTYEIENTSNETLTYTIVGVVTNPNQRGRCNKFSKKETYSQMSYLPVDVNKDSLEYTELCLITDADNVSYQEYWFRGPWFDSLEVYWNDLQKTGNLQNRNYTDEHFEPAEDDTFRSTDTGCLAASIQLKPGESKKIRYLASWYVPNMHNYWGRMAAGFKNYQTDEIKKSENIQWKNYYAVLWKSAEDAARYGISNWETLRNKTQIFRDRLFTSSISQNSLDAVSSTLSVLKSPTVLRLEDGTLYGWEGIAQDAGSCEGSCTHVWNYAQVLPFLFPSLERTMREAEYTYNLDSFGAMTFRLMLPLGAPKWHFRPCVDGQFGTVMKMFREWKISGDIDWLKRWWPRIKLSLEYAWSEKNIDKWDTAKRGIIEGRQHHTLDMELYGANSWLSGMYLGALKAAACMAEAVGDNNSCDEYQRIFSEGKKYLNETLFNGEYFIQKVDLGNKSALEGYPPAEGGIVGEDSVEAYWTEEHNQLKYQIHDGVLIDQSLAQWHANLYGIGEVFNPAKLKKAMKSLFSHNFIPNMRKHINPCRVYSLNDESGLVICSWPEGSEKPIIPIPYSQETMNGFEYTAAVLMIQSGLIKEGESVIKAIRDRYDGHKRNPWNEFECGSNYARSMAAFSILLTYSGFRFDMSENMIGFLPVNDGDVSFFWSLSTAWGNFSQKDATATITVDYGKLTIKKLRVRNPEKVTEIKKGNETIKFSVIHNEVIFEYPVLLAEGEETNSEINLYW